MLTEQHEKTHLTNKDTPNITDTPEHERITTQQTEQLKQTTTNTKQRRNNKPKPSKQNNNSNTSQANTKQKQQT